MKFPVPLAAALCILLAPAARASDIQSQVTDGYADSNGVKIHYASLGSGPLIVMIHGFPDYWYTWREQIAGLADQFQCVAIDQRGYNLSDKPEGVASYAMPLLVGDVIAVIRSLGKDKAIVVGHDWGGAVAWTLAINAPQYVDKLIILNLPHPRGIARELAHNPAQQAASAYARRFQQEGAEKEMKPEQLAFWVKDPEAKQRYIEAFQRSSLTSMLNYYKANYPREPYQEDTSPVVKVKAPVLEFHGLKDTALLPAALDGTWNLVDNDYTLVTIPGAGHFVQQDAAAEVTRVMRAWLTR